MPIHFQLMALPGVGRDEIRQVQSHVHALGQCRKYIRANGWKPIVAGDTAGAAREVSESGDRTLAALAPELAAGHSGLDIIERDVEDSAQNVTRFVVLSRPGLDETTLWAGPTGAGGGTITTFVFEVRNLPAALYKAMGGFATNGVNMTKLESYQIGGTFTATQFYADVEGHPLDTPLRLALEELAFFTRRVSILGVYPARGRPERCGGERRAGRGKPQGQIRRVRERWFNRCHPQTPLPDDGRWRSASARTARPGGALRAWR